MMMKTDNVITVRPSKLEDLTAIATLMSGFTGEEMSLSDAANRFQLIAADPDQELLVAGAGPEVVGLLAFRIRHNLESVSHFGEIASIIVDERWRNRGVGRQLIDRAEVLARERGCLGMWLVSGFGREEEAHKFYHRLGFEQTGVRLVRLFGNGPQ